MIGAGTARSTATSRVASSILVRNKYSCMAYKVVASGRVWLFVYAIFYVFKRTHDTGNISSAILDKYISK